MANPNYFFDRSLTARFVGVTFSVSFVSAVLIWFVPTNFARNPNTIGDGLVGAFWGYVIGMICYLVGSVVMTHLFLRNNGVRLAVFRVLFGPIAFAFLSSYVLDLLNHRRPVGLAMLCVATTFLIVNLSFVPVLDSRRRIIALAASLLLLSVSTVVARQIDPPDAALSYGELVEQWSGPRMLINGDSTKLSSGWPVQSARAPFGDTEIDTLGITWAATAADDSPRLELTFHKGDAAQQCGGSCSAYEGSRYGRVFSFSPGPDYYAEVPDGFLELSGISYPDDPIALINSLQPASAQTYTTATESFVPKTTD